MRGSGCLLLPEGAPGLTGTPGTSPGHMVPAAEDHMCPAGGSSQNTEVSRKSMWPSISQSHIALCRSTTQWGSVQPDGPEDTEVCGRCSSSGAQLRNLLTPQTSLHSMTTHTSKLSFLLPSAMASAPVRGGPNDPRSPSNLCLTTGMPGSETGRSQNLTSLLLFFS